MSVLPDEIIVQILAMLPIKSLIRAKSVCKLWYKLCSDKYLVKLFDEMSLRNRMVFVEVSDSSTPRLICVDYSRGVSEFSLGFLGERVRVSASCDGLLVCVSVADSGVYYVCNPMTREFKLLPSCSDRAFNEFYSYREATLVGLACDTMKHSYSVVLAWYHPSFRRRPEDTFMCKVYNSESGKWRKFALLQDASFTHMSKIQVAFVNGMLHWLACYSSILLLDLCCDVWKKILLPSELSHESGTRVYLLQLDESLSVIQISDSWMNIWVLSNYENQEWTMVEQVSLRCIRDMDGTMDFPSQSDSYVCLLGNKQTDFSLQQKNSSMERDFLCETTLHKHFRAQCSLADILSRLFQHVSILASVHIRHFLFLLTKTLMVLSLVHLPIQDLSTFLGD